MSIGPFYQFQNCDDSEESLTKLIMQLAERVPTLEPDPEVVKNQVQAFKAQVDGLLIQLGQPEDENVETASESSTARLLEELKVIVRKLPHQVHKRLSDSDLPTQRRRMRTYQPMVVREIMHMLPRSPEDPIGILLVTSLFRDEAPWLYELGREAYDSINSRIKPRRERALSALYRALDFTLRSPIGDELVEDSEETRMMLRDLMFFLEQHIKRGEG